MILGRAEVMMTYYILSGKYQDSKSDGIYVTTKYDLEIAEKTAATALFPFIKSKPLRIVFGILLWIALVLGGVSLASLALELVKKFIDVSQAAMMITVSVLDTALMIAAIVVSVKICAALRKKGEVGGNRIFLVSGDTYAIRRKMEELQKDNRSPLMKAMDMPRRM
jgi:hypothetical protein